MFTSFDSFISECSIWSRKSLLEFWDLRFFRGDLRVFDFFGNTHREAHILALGLHFVQVQIYFFQHSVTTFLTCHIQYLPLQEKLSLNGDFPYHFLIIVEKYRTYLYFSIPKMVLYQLMYRNTCTCLLWAMSSYM